jgi:hypothetical protein
MTQAFRVAYAAVAILFVVGVLIQVFLAGMAAFGAGLWSSHVDFGYGVALLPLVLLLLAWPARGGLVLLSLGLLVVAFVQTSLPYFRDDMPVIAALHPVNALLVFGLGVVAACRSIGLASQSRSGSASSAPSVDAAA